MKEVVKLHPTIYGSRATSGPRPPS